MEFLSLFFGRNNSDARRPTFSSPRQQVTIATSNVDSDVLLPWFQSSDYSGTNKLDIRQPVLAVAGPAVDSEFRPGEIAIVLNSTADF